MTTIVAAGALNQIPFGVPDPPREFGQDGGRFYRLYDNLAEEIDDDMIKGLKEQLDGLLIFAGLFAGVNSAFLALTLPLLSADPADDTNALLAQNNAILIQLMQGRNDTSLGNSTLPSTSFSPSHGIFTVNVLFSFSLTLAIISSFLAVLGRQWLVYYRKRSGGGPDRQRWEQLKRFLGAERWRLEFILDDILPSLLQIGLVIFCVSLILYLHVLNSSISRIVGIPMCLGLAIFVLGALFTVWDRFCPFQSPLSHLLVWVTSHLLLWSARIGRIVSKLWRRAEPFVSKLWRRTKSFWPYFWLSVLLALGLLAFYVAILLIPVWLPFVGFAYLVGLPISCDIVSSFSNLFEDLRRRRYYNPSSYQFNIRKSLKRLLRSLFRGYFTESTLRGPKNEVTFLQVVALKRTICTSDDPLTLLCATANIFTIDETRYLEGLWSDEMFHSRFLELCTNPYQRIVQLLGRDRTEAAISAARLYRGALCHIFLSLDPADRHWRFLDGEVPEDIFKAIMSEPLVDSSWLIPPDMVEGCSTALIEAALASWMLRACVEYVPVERIGSHLTEYSDSLSISSWKLVSLIVYVLTRFPHSTEWTGVIQDGPQPFHSSPKRYDTVGSVMTAPPFFTGRPFIQPILIGQPGIRVVRNQQSIQPIATGVPMYPFQPTGQGSPIYPTGTSHPIQQIIVGQPTGVPVTVIQGPITTRPPQPIMVQQPLLTGPQPQPIIIQQPLLTGGRPQPTFVQQPGSPQPIFVHRPGSPQPIVVQQPGPPQSIVVQQPVLPGGPQPIFVQQPGHHQPIVVQRPGSPQPIVVQQPGPPQSIVVQQPVLPGGPQPIFVQQPGHHQPIVVQHPGPPQSIVVQPVPTGGPQPIIVQQPTGYSDRWLIQRTRQTIPLAYTPGPIQYIPTGSPNETFMPTTILPQRIPTGQRVPGPPIPTGHVIVPTFTGHPVPNILGPSRSYTYPVHEVSIDANDMLTRAWPPVLNIGELRLAYTRDVGMTLTSLEEVAIDLARQQYAGDLDCHRILLNILRCAREIMIDESRYPNTRVRDKLGLLDIAEQVLRIEDIPVQVRATATMLRMDCVTMLRLRFMTGDARRKIPSYLLVLLGNFFFKLRARGESSQLSNEEDLIVLQLFGPLLRELYSYPTNVWKIPDGSPWGTPMARLMNLCDEVRQVYHQFRARVDRAFREFRNDGQCNRDPEISWCHRREELDLDLPAQQFSGRLNLPEEGAMADDNSTGLRPIWHDVMPVSPPIPIWTDPPTPQFQVGVIQYIPGPPIQPPIIVNSQPRLSDDDRSLASESQIWTAPPTPQLQSIVVPYAPGSPIQPSLLVDSPPQLSDDGQSLASESHGTVDRTV